MKVEEDYAMTGINKKYLNTVVAVGVEDRANPENKIWIGTGFLIGFVRMAKGISFC